MKEKLLEVLARVNPQLTDGVNFITEGLIDSFEVVNIVMELEEAFDIEIDPEDIVGENFETVDAIVALVKKTINGQEEK